MVDGVSSGDVSATGAAVDADLQLIYRGGENFLARMKALESKKAELEQRTQEFNDALAEMRLGADVKAALDAAKVKETEAAARLETAQRRVSEASVRSNGIIEDARRQAAGILRSAETAATDTKAAAQAVKDEADGHHAEAAKVLADAQETKAKADAAAADVQAAITQSRQAEMAARQTQARYDGLVNHIKQAHQEFVAKVGAKL
jgi:hypothetical protein